MLNKTRIALALAGSLIVGVAGVAMAHPGSGEGSGDKAALLQKYDTNKDGKLDDQERSVMRADFEAKRSEMKAQMLAKYDTNKDGKLDDAERKVMRDDRAIERFKRLDTDGNGSISLAEFKAGAGQGHQGRFGGGFRGHHGRAGRDNK